jgi:hypothetical protein
MKEILIFRNGNYYNQFGSIVYPRRKDRPDFKGIYSRSFQEFEIQAVAYTKLRDFFKNDKVVRGEYSIRYNKDKYCYIRCDIAILNENFQPILIIEVKKNFKAESDSLSQIQIYKKYAPVYVINNMLDAENIVQILLKKELISPI